MSSFSTLLTQPHLSVVSRGADSELARIQNLLEHRVLVDGRGDLEELLGGLLVAAETSGIEPTPKTLDLIGHSIPVSSLLQLGEWVIDAANSTVTSFFRELAELEVLTRLGIHALRLFGCHTACTPAGQRTITTLSEILGIEVYGTGNMVFANHYDAQGFNRDWRFLLVSGSELREREGGKTRTVAAEPYLRTLDVDVLPTFQLEDQRSRWPRRIVSAEVAQRIFRLVRRNEGGLMPGLLASPSCELVLPSARPNAYLLAHVLLDESFLRVYPEGQDSPGVMYPVSEPHSLREIVRTLPAFAPAS